MEKAPVEALIISLESLLREMIITAGARAASVFAKKIKQQQQKKLSYGDISLKHGIDSIARSKKLQLEWISRMLSQEFHLNR